MATFSNFINQGSHDSILGESYTPGIDAEALLMDESVDPVFEDNFVVAGARICAENTINMNNIMQACAIQEFCYFEENGTEMVYEGGAISNFIAKAKEFFLKLWEKIKSIFKKAVMMFSSKTKEDKDFYNKYKTELNKAGNADYGDKEVSMYKYIFLTKGISSVASKSIDDIAGADKLPTTNDLAGIPSVMKTVEELSKAKDLVSTIDSIEAEKTSEDDRKKAVEKMSTLMSTVNESDWKNDVYDYLRAQLIKQGLGGEPGNDVSSSDFAKEIAEACQGDSSKTDVPMGEAVRLSVTYLQNSKDIIKNIDKWLKQWKTDIDKITRGLDNVGKQWSKSSSKSISNAERANGYRHTCLSAYISILKQTRNIGIAFHTGIINQLKACSGQSKSICVQAIHYKKPKNESYAYTQESTGSLLDSVKMV